MQWLVIYTNHRHLMNNPLRQRLVSLAWRLMPCRATSLATLLTPCWWAMMLEAYLRPRKQTMLAMCLILCWHQIEPTLRVAITYQPQQTGSIKWILWPKQRCRRSTANVTIFYKPTWNWALIHILANKTYPFIEDPKKRIRIYSELTIKIEELVCNNPLGQVICSHSS